jgi:hypothetical protein
MTENLLTFNTCLAHGVMTVGMLVLLVGLGVALLHLCVKLMEKVDAIKLGVKLWYKFNGRTKEFERVVDRIIAEVAEDA